MANKEKKIIIEINLDKPIGDQYTNGCRGMTLEGIGRNIEENQENIRRYIAFTMGAIMYDMQLDIEDASAMQNIAGLIEFGYKQQGIYQHKLSKELEDAGIEVHEV